MFSISLPFPSPDTTCTFSGAAAGLGRGATTGGIELPLLLLPHAAKMNVKLTAAKRVDRSMYFLELNVKIDVIQMLISVMYFIACFSLYH